MFEIKVKVRPSVGHESDTVLYSRMCENHIDLLWGLRNDMCSFERTVQRSATTRPASCPGTQIILADPLNKVKSGSKTLACRMPVYCCKG